MLSQQLSLGVPGILACVAAGPRTRLNHFYTAISRKVVGKNVQRQSRKVIWDMINTLFLTTVAVDPTFVAFL